MPAELAHLFAMITGTAAPSEPEELSKEIEKLCKLQSQVEAQEADAADLCAYKERVEAMAAMATAMKEREEAEEAEAAMKHSEKLLQEAKVLGDPAAIKDAEAQHELMKRRWQKEFAEAEEAMEMALVEAEEAKLAEQTAARERSEANDGALAQPGWIEMAGALAESIESDRSTGSWANALEKGKKALGLYEKVLEYAGCFGGLNLLLLGLREGIRPAGRVA